MKCYRADGSLKVHATPSYDLGVSGDFIIINNGRPYIYDADDGLYYELVCSTLNGIRTFAPADVGVTL